MRRRDAWVELFSQTRIRSGIYLLIIGRAELWIADIYDQPLDVIHAQYSAMLGALRGRQRCGTGKRSLPVWTRVDPTAATGRLRLPECHTECYFRAATEALGAAGAAAGLGSSPSERSIWIALRPLKAPGLARYFAHSLDADRRSGSWMSFSVVMMSPTRRPIRSPVRDLACRPGGRPVRPATPCRLRLICWIGFRAWSLRRP